MRPFTIINNLFLRTNKPSLTINLFSIFHSFEFEILITTRWSKYLIFITLMGITDPSWKFPSKIKYNWKPSDNEQKLMKFLFEIKNNFESMTHQADRKSSEIRPKYVCWRHLYTLSVSVLVSNFFSLCFSSHTNSLFRFHSSFTDKNESLRMFVPWRQPCWCSLLVWIASENVLDQTSNFLSTSQRSCSLRNNKERQLNTSFLRVEEFSSHTDFISSSGFVSRAFDNLYLWENESCESKFFNSPKFSGEKGICSFLATVYLHLSHIKWESIMVTIKESLLWIKEW